MIEELFRNEEFDHEEEPDSQTGLKSLPLKIEEKLLGLSINLTRRHNRRDYNTLKEMLARLDCAGYDVEYYIDELKEYTENMEFDNALRNAGSRRQDNLFA